MFLLYNAFVYFTYIKLSQIKNGATTATLLKHMQR